jgi:Protein of unknown function (DUF1592)/Protein of unknown function (DUF1588)/Protein of unknown function (DUF1587)/Protein of unknown function (DUF1595)/Protein of unknown function (DUF1585)
MTYVFGWRRAAFVGVLAALAAGALEGCNGKIGQGAGGTATGGSGGAGSTGAAATGTAGLAMTGAAGMAMIPVPSCTDATTAKPGRSPLRRLNLAEYARTVHDLLGVDTSMVTTTFPPDNTGLGFTNNADVLSVNSLQAEAYMTASEQFATAAVANLPALLPCDQTKVGEDACAKQFIAAFGLRAFRRPLTLDEGTTFFTLYTAGRTGGAFTDGVALVIEGMLQSADFLYRVEATDPTAPLTSTTPVAPYEMATRLSYFLWGTLPDQMLFDAAAAGQLTTPDQVETQVTRMLADARARQAVASFHGEWLSTGVVLGVDKDKTMFPEFTDAIRADMQQELSTFVDQVFWTEGKLETLLTAPYSYMNKELATFYGVTPPTVDGFQKVMLDPTQRAGIVTSAAILASNAKPNQTSPVLRGKFVREQLLCQQLPSPPANLVIVVPQVTPGSTTRQRFAMHESQSSCAACHKLMDGMGLGFEQYDPLGRWRTQDQGLPIDSSGTVIATADIDGDFVGGVALAQKLASSSDVRGCFVREWFRYANGRSEIPADQCTLQSLGTQFDAEGHDMRQLLTNIAMSDAFRYKLTQGGGQ